MRGIACVLGLTTLTSFGCATRALLVTPPTAEIAEVPAARIDGLEALLERVRSETGVPGLAAAVIDARGSIAIAAVGRRRADEPTPLSLTDSFHLGSDTKAMTAFLAARLVERGVLRWEMTLAEAFPEWRGSMDPAYQQVNIAALFRHRAGMTAMDHGAESWLVSGVEEAQGNVAQRRALTRNVLHHVPEVSPGERFIYSNVDYVVAGALMEQHTGKSWEELLREEVFEPLNMDSCGFGAPAHGSERGQPFGHRVEDGIFVPTDADNPSFLGPAGTVHCSLADWASFVRANMDAPTPRLLRPDTISFLHQPIPVEGRERENVGYAMGWGVVENPWGRGPVLRHDGSNGFNYARVTLAPARRLALLIVVNAADERAETATRRIDEELMARSP